MFRHVPSSSRAQYIPAFHSAWAPSFSNLCATLAFFPAGQWLSFQGTVFSACCKVCRKASAASSSRSWPGRFYDVSSRSSAPGANPGKQLAGKPGPRFGLGVNRGASCCGATNASLHPAPLPEFTDTVPMELYEEPAPASQAALHLLLRPRSLRQAARCLRTSAPRRAIQPAGSHGVTPAKATAVKSMPKAAAPPGFPALQASSPRHPLQPCSRDG